MNRSSAAMKIWNGAPSRIWRAKLPVEPKDRRTFMPVSAVNASAISVTANCRSEAAATTGESSCAAAGPEARTSAARAARTGRRVKTIRMNIFHDMSHETYRRSMV